MNRLPSDEIINWIPWKLSGTFCEWMYLSDKKFTEPFFSDTISACKNFYENRSSYKVIADLEIMSEWSQRINTLSPSAFIFHVSRCGSTLLSQMLSLNETNIVLSEVPFFDELLRLPYKNSIDIKIVNNYLIAAIRLYGRKTKREESHFFIKTDSWHLHFYEQLRSLFPGVPFILLFRNPIEVIRSHQKQRGMQSVPGIIEPEIFGFSKGQIKETNLDAYMTNVLEGYFKKMIEISKTDDNIFLCNYNEGINNILKKINNLLNLNITAEAQILMQKRTGFHAKHPQQLFAEEDTEFNTKDFMMPLTQLYNELEDIRLTMQ
ncbi:MAG TPA: hypothetical protein VIJ92_05310 [Ginsengibacter sp.]